MSWQATEAVRDYSTSRGAVRTCGLVMATYADKIGENCHPSLSTIERGAGVTRETAAAARRWFIDHGEAIVTGRCRSGTPILSLRPLVERKGGIAFLDAMGETGDDDSGAGDPAEVAA